MVQQAERHIVGIAGRGCAVVETSGCAELGAFGGAINGDMIAWIVSAGKQASVFQILNL